MNESELNPASPESEENSACDDADGELNPIELEVLPFAVREAFNRAFPEAMEPKFEAEIKDGETLYEVEFRHQDVEVEASYSANGTLLKIEQEIQLDELPDAVTESILMAYPDAIILEAEKIMAADGSVVGYEVEIEDDDVELEIHLDVLGTILDTEEETEIS